MILSTIEKPVWKDWLFHFPERWKLALISERKCKKEDHEVFWAFLCMPPLMSIRNEMKDIPVPATKDDSSVFFIGESFFWPYVFFVKSAI